MYALYILILAATADQIEYDWSIDRSDVSIEAIGEWQSVSIENGMLISTSGMPALPSVSRCYVIPPGNTVLDVAISDMELVSLGRDIKPLPVVYRNTSDVTSAAVSDTELGYGPLPNPFPVNPICGYKTGTKTGYRLGSYSFTPFVYHEDTGELYLITNATIRMIYQPDPTIPMIIITEDQRDLAVSVLSSVVCNPDMLTTWAPVSRPTTDSDYDIAVIGYAQHSNQMNSLADMYGDWAYSVEVETIQWINSNVSGYDVQERIRNYIIQRYQSSGLQYVVLCGDVGASTRFTSLLQATYPYEPLNSVVDMYFSDLDGDWDGDGDHLYGECSDSIDYYSDVYVGRYPAGITEGTEFYTMLDKVDSYSNEPEAGDWRNRALLLGAILQSDFSAGNWCHGSKYCDSLTTFFPAGFQWNTVYEDSSGGHANNQLDLINEGVSFLAYAAHGLYVEFLWYHPFFSDQILSCDSIEYMSNGQQLPWVDGCISCNTGAIGNAAVDVEGFLETMFQYPEGGMVAGIGNSGPSLIMLEDPGPAGWMSIYHTRYLFEEDRINAGVSLAAAKDLFWANWNSFYPSGIPENCLQVLNLIGDPLTPFIGTTEGFEGNPQAEFEIHLTSNPIQHQMGIRVNTSSTLLAEIAIFDMAGRVVQRSDLQLGQEVQEIIIDTSTLPGGLYMVSFECQDFCWSEKVILLR